jgi:hypothetical protein
MDIPKKVAACHIMMKEIIGLWTLMRKGLNSIMIIRSLMKYEMYK